MLRISHAQHDGMSIAKLWNAVEKCLDGHLCSVNPTTASFSQHMSVISHADKDASKSYWRELLAGSCMTGLKTRKSHKPSLGSGWCVTSAISRANLPLNNFTFSTILKSAWAYVLACNCGRDDIVFGALTHARSHPRSQDVFGACVTVLPVRVSIAEGCTVRDLVTAVNCQQIGSMQHETLVPREIIRECTDWPKWASFGSIVHHQNFDSEEHGERVRSMHGDSPETKLSNVDDVQVHVTSMPDGDCGTKIVLSFAAGVVSETIAQQLIKELVDTVIAFHRSLDIPLSSPQEICALMGPPPLPWTDPATAKEALEGAWTALFGNHHDPGTFYEAGGDLVSAGLLSAHMQRDGYRLSVDDILGSPTRHQQLRLLSKSEGSTGSVLTRRPQET